MNGFEIGQRAKVTRRFTQDDVAEYAALTGDTHLGSAGHQCDTTVVPGPLIGGLFSYLLGTRLPGRGTNWLKQQLRFEQPARVGDTLTATVEITRLRPEKDLVNLETICRSATGNVVCDGEALVLVRDVKEGAGR